MMGQLEERQTKVPKITTNETCFHKFGGWIGHVYKNIKPIAGVWIYRECEKCGYQGHAGNTYFAHLKRITHEDGKVQILRK